jgi:acetyl-CoA carboxylase/biotin carboxylase 1
MAPATNGVNGHKASASRSWQDKHALPSHFIGGNKLSAAPSSAVKEFVTQGDGHSVITSVSRRKETCCRIVADRTLPRFSLRTTVSQPSKRFDPCENGHTRPSETSEPSNSQ